MARGMRVQRLEALGLGSGIDACLWGAKTRLSGLTCALGRRGFVLVDQAAEYSPTTNGPIA